MKCDPFDVLHHVVRITNRATTDYSRSFKDILRYIVRALHLREASFLLLDNHQKNFSHKITASEGDFFVPFRSGENSPGLVSLQRRQPVSADDLLYFPAFNNRRAYGVLILRPASESPLSDSMTKVFEAVCDQLAALAQYGILAARARHRVGQLTLLSELGRELNQARTLRDLFRSAVRSVLRHSNASCVILRPLLGETLLGRSYIRTRPSCRHLRPEFVAMEEKHAIQALEEKNPVFFLGLPEDHGEPPDPKAMVIIPLVFQERALGTLTLFGDSEENGLTLAPDMEAKRLFSLVGSQIAHALERIAGWERTAALSRENDRKLRETTLLNRISRAMHSTLRLNELTHLILSAATVPEGGGFERAMLFMINERSGTLQGMLGVTGKTATRVLPMQDGIRAWEKPVISSEVLNAQRRAHFCRRVMNQRLTLDPRDNALARAARKGRAVYVAEPEKEPPSGAEFASALRLSPYACVPLPGRDGALGVLVVDNPSGKDEINADRLRLLELFASQAGGAIQNSMLVNRLENAHQDLQETQERLIQGEKMAVLGEMAASVAHELRNPLVSIGGFAQRLARITAADSREHEYSSIIAREVRRMEEMLTNILAFSKKHIVCLAECRLSGIIEEALSVEMDALRRAGIRVKTDIPANLPIIKGDEQKLRQVMINLIANARQVMPGGGTLFLRACRASLRGEKAVEVEVEDTGGGIPAEVLRNIFNPFFSTKDEGTGLGLSISHRIIEQHRGEIEVQNRKTGALFTLRLPVNGNAQLSVDKIERFG